VEHISGELLSEVVAIFGGLGLNGLVRAWIRHPTRLQVERERSARPVARATGLTRIATHLQGYRSHTRHAPIQARSETSNDSATNAPSLAEVTRRDGEKPRAGHPVREVPGDAAAGGAPRGTGGTNHCVNPREHQVVHQRRFSSSKAATSAPDVLGE